MNWIISKSNYISSLTRSIIFVIVLLISQSNCAEQYSDKDFQRDVLDEHNNYRSTHKASPLTLDDKLSKNATLAAQAAAKKGNFDMISPGQSVFVSCATFKRDVSGKEVSDAWYGEVCNPDFDFNNPDSQKTRGFTQLVWKDTNRLGVGRATGTNANKEICTYIVGVYRPPGNLEGFFQENVEEGSFDKEDFCGDDTDSSSQDQKSQFGEQDSEAEKQDAGFEEKDSESEEQDSESEVQDSESEKQDSGFEEHDLESEEEDSGSKEQKPTSDGKNFKGTKKQKSNLKKSFSHSKKHLPRTKKSKKKATKKSN